MRPPRKIIGIQIHHSVNYDDAARFGVNMLTALDVVLSKLVDPPVRLLALRDQLGAAVIDIGRFRQEAIDGMRDLWETDPETFRNARDGYVPWPGENDNIEPRERGD